MTAIELLPGTTPLCSHILSLALAAQKIVDEYVQEALTQQYIVLSTSPASTGFFFVEKKGGGLWQYIDYRCLNKIIVKYPYPHPLVPSALEQLCSVHMFTKLKFNVTK